MKTENEIKEIREEQIVFGWSSIEDAAMDIYKGVNQYLLNGAPLFLYKSTTTGSTLQQVVVVKYDDQTYGVGIITSAWTSLYPKVPVEYLNDLEKDLESWKVEKEVREVYHQIITRDGKSASN